MKFLPTVFFSLAILTAASGAANAAPVDFVAEAAGNERGIASGTAFSSANFGGLTLRFDSSDPNHFPYFDDLESGRPAGLGLCKALVAGPGSECANSGDDNITAGEGVTITFLDGPYNLRNLSFNDVEHFSLNSDNVGKLLININGVGDVDYTFAGAIDAANSGAFLDITSIKFSFLDTQFYISSLSDTPVPAALPLIITGCFGLFAAVKRRRRLG